MLTARLPLAVMLLVTACERRETLIPTCATMWDWYDPAEEVRYYALCVEADAPAVGVSEACDYPIGRVPFAYKGSDDAVCEALDRVSSAWLSDYEVDGQCELPPPEEIVEGTGTINLDAFMSCPDYEANRN